MAFMPEESTSQFYKLAQQLTKQLHAVVGPDRKVKVSFEAWNKEFDILLRHKGEADVKPLLDWYCKNHGKQYVPVVTTAKMFREKYNAIEAARSRDVGSVTTTDEHTAIAVKLAQSYDWPVEIINYLPAIVKVTIDNWRKFLKLVGSRVEDMKQMQNQVPAKDRLMYDREMHFLYKVVLEKHNFLHEWFHILNESVKGYEHYHGNPKMLAFSIDCDRFKYSFWQEWTVQWTGRILVFDSLLRDLIEETKRDPVKA